MRRDRAPAWSPAVFWREERQTRPASPNLGKYLSAAGYEKKR